MISDTDNNDSSSNNFKIVIIVIIDHSDCSLKDFKFVISVDNDADYRALSLLDEKQGCKGGVVSYELARNWRKRTF